MKEIKILAETIRSEEGRKIRMMITRKVIRKKVLKNTLILKLAFQHVHGLNDHAMNCLKQAITTKVQKRRFVETVYS
jgi:hypothetical protein